MPWGVRHTWQSWRGHYIHHKKTMNVALSRELRRRTDVMAPRQRRKYETLLLQRRTQLHKDRKKGHAGVEVEDNLSIVDEVLTELGSPAPRWPPIRKGRAGPSKNRGAWQVDEDEDEDEDAEAEEALPHEEQEEDETADAGPDLDAGMMYAVPDLAAQCS